MDGGNDLLGESLHLLRLGRELEESQVRAGALEGVEPLGDFLRSSDEARAKAAVGDRVVLEADALLELRAGEPLVVVGIATRARADVGDAGDLAPRRLLGPSADDETRD